MPDKMRIALLGNATTEYMGSALYEECSRYNIAAEIYNSPFNQYRQEILDRDSAFYNTSPSLAILFLEGSELFPLWYETKYLLQEASVKESGIGSIFNDVKNLVEAIHTNRPGMTVIINNFRIPSRSPLGILDNRHIPGLGQMVAELNRRIEEFASGTDYAYVFDYNGFCSRAGLCGPRDHKMYYFAGSTLTIGAAKLISHEYMKYILPISGRSRKCLVLDLDNTLWGGIAGEDGISGISLDITGTGLCYYNFQKEILNLYNKGILLAICSKNNIEDAVEILDKHPRMLLRRNYFACLKINWQDKAVNLVEITKELNIGLDSLVFFDDNPVERELVKKALPEVAVVEVPPDPSRYCEALGNIIEFERLEITKEDIRRNEMYANNMKYEELKQISSSLEEYLAALETKLHIGYADEFSIPRIAQLTQKTNQFNMTTKRYQPADIINMMGMPYFVLYCSVSDKFGDSGITGCCIVKINVDSKVYDESNADNNDGTDSNVDNNANVDSNADTPLCAEIDTFLLSCRVLGRKIEYAFLQSVVRLLRSTGIGSITADYWETSKNKANRYFYKEAGFDITAEDDKHVRYVLPMSRLPSGGQYIETFLPEGLSLKNGTDKN